MSGTVGALLRIFFKRLPEVEKGGCVSPVVCFDDLFKPENEVFNIPFAIEFRSFKDGFTLIRSRHLAILSKTSVNRSLIRLTLLALSLSLSSL